MLREWVVDKGCMPTTEVDTSYFRTREWWPRPTLEMLTKLKHFGIFWLEAKNQSHTLWRIQSPSCGGSVTNWLNGWQVRNCRPFTAERWIKTYLKQRCALHMHRRTKRRLLHWGSGKNENESTRAECQKSIVSNDTTTSKKRSKCQLKNDLMHFPIFHFYRRRAWPGHLNPAPSQCRLQKLDLVHLPQSWQRTKQRKTFTLTSQFQQLCSCLSLFPMDMDESFSPKRKSFWQANKRNTNRQNKPGSSNPQGSSASSSSYLLLCVALFSDFSWPTGTPPNHHCFLSFKTIKKFPWTFLGMCKLLEFETFHHLGTQIWRQRG